MSPPPTEGLASRLFVGPALRTQPDRRLVTLVRDGYDTAFEEIVRRHGKALTRYAAAIVGGRSEDVTQDAFSKALLALRRNSEAEIDLKPWLYRIVRNTALNDLRDNPPGAAELTEALAGGSPSAAEEAERREEVADLIGRLRDLPEAQRAAIVMRELEGLSHDEIAAALGLSGGGARQAIYRARQALRDGAGMLLPLPLLRLLMEHGAEAGVAAAGAGGAAVAAGGAGTALKVGVVTAVLAGSVGTGLAINENRSHHRDAEAAAAATVPGGGNGSDSSSTSSGSTRSIPAASAPALGSRSSTEDGGGDPDNSGPGSVAGIDGSGELEPGDDSGGGHSGPGPSGPSHQGGRGPDGGDHGGGGGPDHGGPGHGGGSGDPGSPPPQNGQQGSGSGHDASGHGGPGPGGGGGGQGSPGGGSGGSGESGGGPGPSDAPLLPPAPQESGSSGSGSSGSGEGSSGPGSDSSGSGPGDGDA